jgi:hypothetical protein
MSCHQNVGENHNVKTENKSFEMLAKLKHLRLTAINQNLIHMKSITN